MLRPRVIRFRDAPRYVGMDRNLFNAEVRPYLTEIPIGKQGVGFDRLELDAWLDEYSRPQRASRTERSKHMGRKHISGLIMRDGIWHIDKRICGRRVCQSTGTGDIQEAEHFLAKVMEQTRQAVIYGVRPARTFEQAAAKFVLENQHKRSIGDDVMHLKMLMPWIGNVPLDKIYIGTLQPWIIKRRSEGRSPGTINHGLKVVRRILNLASSEWGDDNGMTWIPAAPKIKLLPDKHKRPAYPLSWDEQALLFGHLPSYLAQMALFTVNTGCRDQEVCNLRWEWEVVVPELGTSVFIVPGSQVKNGDDRLVVLNRMAKSVIEVASWHQLRARLHLRGSASRAYDDAGLEKSSSASWPSPSPCSRPQAHLRAPTEGGRGELRGSARPVGTPIDQDYNPLLGG